jgi:Icc-related predicted phosphoesterase
MTFAFISDTHGKHGRLQLPKADVLIHAGDVTKGGECHQAEDFINWLGKLDYRYKIFIAGNHDFYFEEETEKQIVKLLPPVVIYLNDSGTIIEGLHIWGSPITPWFFDWAFNRERGKPIAKHWKLIPPHTDILITHGPPFGILDKTGTHHLGCKELWKKVKRVKPRVHVFGHIHEAYGLVELNGTTFINACVVDENYEIKNPAINFELKD